MIFFTSGLIASGADRPASELELVFRLSLAPSGITIASDGNWVMSVNQVERPRNRVVKVSKTGDVVPFPNTSMSEALQGESLPLDAVEGVGVDKNAVIWMVDNGRRSEMTPKVIGWNSDRQRLDKVVYLAAPALVPGSFLSEIAVDSNLPYLYVSDPANGLDAALIVIDLTTGLSRRVLQGHEAVVPDLTVPLTSGRNGPEIRRLDGSHSIAHCGVDAVAIDRKGEWLYFAPVRSQHLYRIRTEALRNTDLSVSNLANQVERYAQKPPSASISIDVKGNVYVADINQHAIGLIPADKKNYRILVSDPRLAWPDGLCFGVDEKLYFFSRTPGANTESTTMQAPLQTSPPANDHIIFRIKPLAPGRPGD